MPLSRIIFPEPSPAPASASRSRSCGHGLVDSSDAIVMVGDLPTVGDALAEPLTAPQVVGGMAVAAGASVGQGEVHHRSQGDGGGQGMGLVQLLGGGPQQGVVVSIQLAAAFHHELWDPAEAGRPMDQEA